MGTLKLSNNASSLLAGSITSSDTLLSVTTGDGAKFPSLGTGDWFPLTIVNSSGGYEIVKATARTGDVITVTRAQEGTAGTAFASGSRVDLRMTAAAFESLIPNGTAMLGGNNLSDVTNVVSARANLGLGDIATHSVSEFATAAQGAEADTAMQPFAGQSSSAAKVASTGAYADLSGTPTLFSGAYADLTGKPTLGTAAAKNVGGANGVVGPDGNGYISGDGRNITNLPNVGVATDSYGLVGQFVLATCSAQPGYGTTVAGSTLRATDASGTSINSTVLTGTWRCLCEMSNAVNEVGLLQRTA
jgi:hypothetical protein